MNFKEMRLIDTLIATKVNGWLNVTKSGKVSMSNWYDAAGEIRSSMAKYQPTINISQAMASAEHVGAFNTIFVPGLKYQVCMDPYARISTGFVATGEGKTAALAICQAMLASLSIMTEDFSTADDLLEKDTVPKSGQIYPLCKECGRPLKSRKSQIRGYGPTCYEKASSEPNQIDLLDDYQDQKNFVDELEEQRC